MCGAVAFGVNWEIGKIEFDAGLSEIARGAQENLWPKLFSGAPRCAPLRLVLLEHMPCRPQIIQNTSLAAFPVGSNCSAARKIYFESEAQNKDRNVVEIDWTSPFFKKSFAFFAGTKSRRKGLQDFL